MAEYTVETQGLNTYRIYECGKEDVLDTVAVGMMQNNQIQGLLPMQVLHRDNICSLKFNISSKITLQQLLAGGIGRERFLKVIRHILDIVMQMEEYLLELGQLLLNVEDIYVNVSTLDTEILYYPVLGAAKPIDLNGFLKEILFSTEFDRSENCDYVVSLMNYLNTNKDTDVMELKKEIEAYLLASCSEADKTAAENRKISAQPQQPSVQSRPVIQPQQVIQPQPAVQKPVTQSAVGPASPAKLPKEKKDKKEKKSLFGKKSKTKTTVPDGIAIPGMEQTPQPAMQTPQPAMQTPQPAMQTPQPAMQTPQPAIQTPQPVMQPSSPMQPNFGETTVLQAPAIGETTVLGMELQEQPLKREFILERKKTGESIVLNKEYFRMGKERQYADYCILDNPAVSRSHADIIKRDDEYYLKDNNSLNHTFVNGVQVQAQTPQLLQEGDLIMLANEEFVFKAQSEVAG